jgi:hypothetical protein
MFQNSWWNHCVFRAISLVCCAALSPIPLMAESLTFTVSTPEFRITSFETHHRIEVEGFGRLLEPGKPDLPIKNYTIALPPGARVRSVTVTAIGSTMIPGVFRIEPAPALQPLGDPARFAELRRMMQSEWQANCDAVYSSDQSYPERSGFLTEAGTLRKYAYAAVSFCPFSYCPTSGALTFHAGASITIDYSLPAPGGAEALHLQHLMHDTAADRRAERIFHNYNEMRRLYEVPESPKPESQATADYLIVTAQGLYETVISSDFVAWKESLGFEVETISIYDLRILCMPGADLAEKLRNFLRAVYGPWGVEYVLLVGGIEDVPMRYCYPDPYNHVNNAGTPNAYSGEVPTDYYYADLSGDDDVSWDQDHDGFHGEWSQDMPDFLAEVYVGRIPTSDSLRVVYTLDKLVRYEQDEGDWKHHALHAASFAWFANEDHSGSELKDLATYLDSIETQVMSGWTVHHFSELKGLVRSIYPWTPLNGAAFANAWRNGQYGVVNWGGHGWSDLVVGKYWSWDDGDGVPETSYPDEMVQYPFIGTTFTLEDDYPSIVFALSCLVGYPEPNGYGNLAIDLLTKPSFGAAAATVSGTRLVWVSRGGGEQHCYEFNHYLIDGPDGPCRVGEALYDSDFFVHQTYTWNHFADYQDMFCNNLYGDPSMIWEGTAVSSTSQSRDYTPSACRLYQNYPNPFNPLTIIPFEMSDAGFVNISIYSVDGTLVQRLVDRSYEAGRHEVIWYGTNTGGRRVASGTYFYRMQIGSHIETQRMTLVK